MNSEHFTKREGRRRAIRRKHSFKESRRKNQMKEGRLQGIEDIIQTKRQKKSWSGIKKHREGRKSKFGHFDRVHNRELGKRV